MILVLGVLRVVVWLGLRIVVGLVLRTVVWLGVRVVVLLVLLVVVWLRVREIVISGVGVKGVCVMVVVLQNVGLCLSVGVAMGVCLRVC